VLDRSFYWRVTLAGPYRSETEALGQSDDRHVSADLLVEARVIAGREFEEHTELKF